MRSIGKTLSPSIAAQRKKYGEQGMFMKGKLTGTINETVHKNRMKASDKTTESVVTPHRHDSTCMLTQHDFHQIVDWFQ